MTRLRAHLRRLIMDSIVLDIDQAKVLFRLVRGQSVNNAELRELIEIEFQLRDIVERFVHG